MIDESFRVNRNPYSNIISELPSLSQVIHRSCIRSTSLFPTNRLLDLLVRNSPANLLSRLPGWRERARSRRLLRLLDDRMLRDVGLSSSDVDRECSKHFW